jgi:hypothetical protein
MDPAKIGLAVQNGLSIVCATCKRYWEGRDQGLPEPQCTTKTPCGSPLAGMAFPNYDGPITDFTRWCFVCGQGATHVLQAPGEARQIGVCDEHVNMREEVKPVGVTAAAVPLLIDASGRELPVAPPPPKTLGQAIAEAEAEMAGETGD